MHVAIRRYTVSRPEAAADFVRRVMAERAPTSAAATPPAEWAVTEWGFAPLLSRTPGFVVGRLSDRRQRLLSFACERGG
jgi:hypothetical protein